MADKTVNFNSNCNLCESHIEALAKWLSCNGEAWGVGPTAVFASAAALFLYNELESTVFIAGDHAHVSLLEKTLISTMVLGMLALMIHLWVCSMRFFQYYLDTLIRDSPNMLLEMTTAGLLGKNELVPLGPLTRFLRQQQPQIHITVCWFLSLCYADYVRKHYCQRFNMPYLEQWQAELHERASRGVRVTMQKVNSFVGSVHQRLRGYAQQDLQTSDAHTVRAQCQRSRRRWRSADPVPAQRPAAGLGRMPALMQPQQTKRSCACDSSASRARRLLTRLRNSAPISQQPDARVAVHRSPASLVLAPSLLKRRRSLEDYPWRQMAKLPCNWCKPNHILEWAKCGESMVSTVPTVLWAVGAAALAHRLLAALFRRFLFRRVPLWEIVLQNLLFIWMVIYSLHFWVVVVKVIKVIIEFCYDEEDRLPSLEDDIESRKLMQQWAVWMIGVAPLAAYLHTRPRPETTPLMIWITTSPWQRREMGPYGYYLNRPLTSLQSTTNVSSRQQIMILRRAYSDSKIYIQEPAKKRRHSKSV